MGEVIHTPGVVAEFMASIGHLVEVDPQDVITYPVYRPRMVFRHPANGAFVTKVRSESNPEALREARVEAEKTAILLDFYSSIGVHFEGRLITGEVGNESERYMVMETPYMGETITALAGQMELAEIGYGEEGDFQGFSRRKLKLLLSRFRRDMDLLRERYGLVHGDLFRENFVGGGESKPNNIVYSPIHDRLLVIDAEALTEANERYQGIFEQQFAKAEDWMINHLTRGN